MADLRCSKHAKVSDVYDGCVPCLLAKLALTESEIDERDLISAFKKDVDPHFTMPEKALQDDGVGPISIYISLPDVGNVGDIGRHIPLKRMVDFILETGYSPKQLKHFAREFERAAKLLNKYAEGK